MNNLYLIVLCVPISLYKKLNTLTLKYRYYVMKMQCQIIFVKRLFSKNYCRPELERISTLFDGCLFSGIPKGSFLCLAPTIEAGSGKVLPVEAVGKIV